MKLADWIISPSLTIPVLKLKIGIYADMKLRADFVKERERQLRLSEELLATARYLSGTREKADVGIVVADAHGRIRQMNDELLRIFRYPGGADPAADVSEGYKRYVSDQLPPVLTSVRASQASRREPVQIRCADGSGKSVLCSVSLLRDSNSVAAGMAMVVYDVSQSAESRMTWSGVLRN
jgi:PAS domain-containing protein